MNPSFSPLKASFKLIALVILASAAGLRAQELSVLGGTMNKANEEAILWQVDYRQNFHRNFAGSIAYINEGHVPGHHRDGTAFEAWGRLPLFQGKIEVSLGAGAYYFFDTQWAANGDTLNVHDTAPIYSFSATGYLSNRWFYRLMLNRISPANDVQVTTAGVGVGFWFGRDRRPVPGKLGDSPGLEDYVTENQLTVFVGQSVVNTFLSQQARAYAVEYRRGLLHHLDWTVSGIYEGDPQIIRRNGIATQVWFVNTFYNKRVSVGAGLGPYIYLDHKNPSGTPGIHPAAVTPLVSLSLSTRLSDDWLLRLVFDRVTTRYNRDSDIFLLGLGYRWGAGKY